MPRQKFRRFDCYPDDFLAGTAGMDPVLFKAHTRLFMRMYSDGGPLRYDPRALMWIMEVKRPVDAEKLIKQLIETKHYYLDEDGFLHHPRVDNQLGLTPKRASNGAQTELKRASNGLQTERKSQQNQQNEGTNPARARAPSPSPDTSNEVSSSLASLARNQSVKAQAREPKKKTASKKTFVVIRDTLETALSADMAQAVIQHRNITIKKPLTPLAASQLVEQFRKAEEAGIPPDDSAALMIRKGWRGFEADWAIPRNASPTARSPPAAGSPPASDADEYSEENMRAIGARLEAKFNARK